MANGNHGSGFGGFGRYPFDAVHLTHSEAYRKAVLAATAYDARFSNTFKADARRLLRYMYGSRYRARGARPLRGILLPPPESLYPYTRAQDGVVRRKPQYRTIH